MVPALLKRKRCSKDVFSKGSVLRKMTRKAPEGRAVPRKRIPLDTSPVGVDCCMQTGRSYGTLSRGDDGALVFFQG
jgi:hypothetical protein